MSREKIATAKSKIQELIQDGFVMPSDKSDWLIPIHLVRKPDGRWRFCLDLRRLNLLTVQDNYPLPKIQTITDEIRDMRFFTKLDIKDGFFRVPLDKHSQHKNNFKVGANCYKFVVLPMGYRNAPNIFQRVMENILQGIIEKYCIVYIDGILIYSKDITRKRTYNSCTKKTQRIRNGNKLEESSFCHRRNGISRV
ncbi:hypothetical protein NEIG_02557 [Nematocida sp. ERTm5]|nr:hypothetical protein NEIG_02557 [Nematocida sp. ERTm5]